MLEKMNLCQKIPKITQDEQKLEKRKNFAKQATHTKITRNSPPRTEICQKSKNWRNFGKIAKNLKKYIFWAAAADFQFFLFF